ncbi:GTP-binding protein [Aurantimonas sp. HBX-1]|uniref:CobW family GTP-binding protein n=1 Tax=Aurantimonas sp. HBX-1 TaxID=2906072 RepID=UPI001F4404EF|nr:GTP-binding protein [Aurantimonas sp. HBX-1]UIJ72381.1 GTP-binding protein [Aurantimonas sp. HBX-1]
MNGSPRAAPAPIRLTVLTGFLGAGKTSLLNRLLAETPVANLAVVVNEFGAVGLDQMLIETAASDGVIELSEGCVCCTVRGALVDTLVMLATRARPAGAPPLERVIVETTGLADPTPILASLMTHEMLAEAYALDGVVTVVDHLAGAANLAERPEARRQVAVADRIVLTKGDLAADLDQGPLLEALDGLNPAALRIDATDGQLLAQRLLGCGVVDPATGKADPGRWLGAASAAHGGHAGHHEHAGHAPHGAIRSFALVRPEPVAWEAVAAFLDLMAATQGERILRMKAVVHLREDPSRPVVLHGVRSYQHPPAQLAAWPAGMARETRIVLIGEHLDETYARDLFAAFTGGLRSDAPDRAALEANPLAVPGHSFG